MSATVTQQQSGDATTLRMAARRADGTVLCTSRAPPEGAAATLRCRFPGGMDVPAQRCASSGGVVCTPPPDGGGGAAQPYECYADDALLAEGVYDPTAAPADAPAPPSPPKRGGMRPFAIMCAATPHACMALP